MTKSFKKNVVLAFFAGVFSLGILTVQHWDFALLFAVSIFVAYQWLFERNNRLIYLIFALFISVIYAYLLSPLSLAFASYFLLGLSVLTYEKGLNWRSIPFLKPFMITICWFSLGIGIPIYHLGQQIAPNYLIHLLILFMLALVEDVADINKDKGYLKTIPLFLSRSQSSCVIIVLLFIYLGLLSRIDIFSQSLSIQFLSILLAISPILLGVYLQKSVNIDHQYADFLLFLIGVLYLLTA